MFIEFRDYAHKYKLWTSGAKPWNPFRKFHLKTLAFGINKSNSFAVIFKTKKGSSTKCLAE